MPRTPLSYDEITRHTVVEPDGSWRPDPPPPTEAEQRLDQKIREAVTDALISHGIETLGLEVVGGRVILRGWVRDQGTEARVARIIGEAAPEAVIDNRMRIGVP